MTLHTEVLMASGFPSALTVSSVAELNKQNQIVPSFVTMALRLPFLPHPKPN